MNSQWSPTTLRTDCTSGLILFRRFTTNVTLILAVTAILKSRTVKTQNQNNLFVKSSIDNSTPGPEVIKLFSCTVQLRLKLILLINVKMPKIVGILTFISRINYRFW